MKDLAKVRNIGISAHIDSGKTTLTERILFYSGKTHKIGDVKKEGATMDHMELEKEKGITITSAATSVAWDGHPINIIDTPGHVDFTVEVERSLRVLDGAILVLCAVSGVQSQSLTVDRQMKRYKVPRLAFINKLDRTGSDPDSVISQMRDKLGINPVQMQVPIGLEDDHDGVVDLISRKAYVFEDDKTKKDNFKEVEIPADMVDLVEEKRHDMLEALSMFDDNLMEALLAEEEYDETKLHQLIRDAVLAHEIVPVYMGSAFKNKAVQPLLDAIVRYLPNPTEVENYAIDNDQFVEGEDPKKIRLKPDDDLPLVCMAFKIVLEQFGQLTYTRIYQGKIVKGETYVNTRTGQKVRFGRLVRMHANDREDLEEAGAGDIIAVVAVDCASGDTFCGDGKNYSLESIYAAEPVITRSVEPTKRDGADKLAKALERFRREDPTFHVRSDEETGQTLIAGMGQLHLEVYIERIKREYGVECEVGAPRVAYRERPTRGVVFDYKHKKQSGGSGQYGHVKGNMEPLPEDAEEQYEFVNEITQGKIPKEYIPAIDKGFRSMLDKGPLAECEVVGVKMTVNDGSYHDVDSSEMAFQAAGRGCMREEIFTKGKFTLMEPIMKLEIEAPEEFQGSVAGHLASKRGLINNISQRGQDCVIDAECPLSELFDYANELRSMTQGKGNYSMEFAKYGVVPQSLQPEIIAKRKAEKEARLAKT
ncbi:elongation factor G [Stratiformator vulcanicus]|uniref:Elongation factor G n=1 Tax=Stratiformator vulcanicus TaxID=2527980 RepID=A0A517QZU2_9PLAN|nr:elongation factor G [Stratiformator vulcanicus]QDT37162.1 Elongation factor G [Stratiformator vulcanicus]